MTMEYELIAKQNKLGGDKKPHQIRRYRYKPIDPNYIKNTNDLRINRAAGDLALLILKNNTRFSYNNDAVENYVNGLSKTVAFLEIHDTLYDGLIVLENDRFDIAIAGLICCSIESRIDGIFDELAEIVMSYRNKKFRKSSKTKAEVISS